MKQLHSIRCKQVLTRIHGFTMAGCESIAGLQLAARAVLPPSCPRSARHGWQRERFTHVGPRRDVGYCMRGKQWISAPEIYMGGLLVFVSTTAVSWKGLEHNAVRRYWKHTAAALAALSQPVPSSLLALRLSSCTSRKKIAVTCQTAQG